ncbi:uncharacterized protein LOC119490812 isoform X1 [Scomber scombrus]|uniref:Uncharacterized protein LOC119490812 isoform X1 n=1 Tax=Scomber scombrus TaxID=13677 RepID=A0AAV1P0T9_SCOSC
MAACNSFPLCAPVGLLLLLLGLFSSHPPEVQARPTDFWCNRQERKRMEQRTFEDLKKDMADCVGSDVLSSTVQLPSVRLHVAEWENKTLQQKHAEVLGALQVFQAWMATNQTTLQCQSSLLKKLQRQITNHLLIVNQIPKQIDAVVPSENTIQESTSQTRLKKVLDQYEKLIKVKLERLAKDLEGIICKVLPSATT